MTKSMRKKAAYENALPFFLPGKTRFRFEGPQGPENP